MSSAPPLYTKTWLPFEELLSTLIARGLVVADRQTALAFLRHTNYYRFRLYCVAFEDKPQSFAQGTTFEQVRSAYEFDRDLRDLLTEGLEAVEIDLRAAVAYQMAKQHGPFGYTSPSRFHNSFDHPDWLTRLRAETQRSSEAFIKRFLSSYRAVDLPIWAATEVMSFGSLSELYRGMLKPDQKAVCSRYHLQPGELAGWIHHFTYVRNLCAHHCRIWDRTWSIRPPLPSAAAWRKPYLDDNTRLFVTLLCLNFVLRRCPGIHEFASAWKSRVEARIAAAPPLPDSLQTMGLAPAWNTHPLW